MLRLFPLSNHMGVVYAFDILFSPIHLESPVFPFDFFFLLQGVCCARPDLPVAQRKNRLRDEFTLVITSNLRPFRFKKKCGLALLVLKTHVYISRASI
jgi:hypothetical protein